jgi:hypothetical protein
MLFEQLVVAEVAALPLSTIIVMFGLCNEREIWRFSTNAIHRLDHEPCFGIAVG